MRKYHARFLEGWATARSPGYSARAHAVSRSPLARVGDDVQDLTGSMLPRPLQPHPLFEGGKVRYSVSIVINNYNYDRYLKDAIDSALNQTVPAHEIVVVDDGSTDDSRAIIESYGDLVTPVLQENGGQRKAYNS